MSSILIVGGSGCISSAIVDECLATRIKTTIINRGRKKTHFPYEINFIKADRDDLDKISNQIGSQKFTAVIDFLCYTADELKKSVEFYTKYTNQYIFISSCAVYDFRRTSLGKEDSPKVDNRWDYSINKWESEELLRKLSRRIGFNYTIVRPSVTYGDTRIPYGITPPYGKHGTIIQRILKGKPIIRWNEGTNISNMMRVEDFAKLFIPLIGNPAAYNQEFNICSQETYSYNDVLAALETKLQTPVRTLDISPEEYARQIPYRHGEIIAGRATDCISTPSKVKLLVPNFQERYNLQSGISRTVDAYLDNDWMDGIDYQFEGECDRVVRNWCKQNKIGQKYKYGFIDYLGTATWRDRLTYYKTLYKDTSIIRIINLLQRLYHRIRRLSRI